MWPFSRSFTSVCNQTLNDSNQTMGHYERTSTETVLFPNSSEPTRNLNKTTGEAINGDAGIHETAPEMPQECRNPGRIF